MTLLLALWACDGPPERPEAYELLEEPRGAQEAHYLGSRACADCHVEQTAAWEGSHHERAMTPASEALGRVPAAIDHHGVSWRMEVWEGHPWFAEGLSEQKDGGPAPFALGVSPLQQRLVHTDDGGWAATPMAWDARPEDEGGRRWYALPEGPTPPGDPLHWRGPAFQADHQCLPCHTTGFEKRFEGGRFGSTWAEATVGCEACHGPGSVHVDWAEDGAEGDPWLLPLEGNPAERWRIDPATGIARVPDDAAPHPQVDTCAPCHARASHLDDLDPRLASLDQLSPALIEEGLYFPDGQILDEVYVWGSFQQSAMHAAGVTCTDCHDPHGAGLKREGDATCGTCHDLTRFGAEAHTHHAPGHATCVDCHMRPRIYMGVDARHDHGFRVPRPQRAADRGTPEPCTTCHDDRDVAWADATATTWWGDADRPEDAWTEALRLGRMRGAGAPDALVALLSDADAPPILRATAAEGLGPWPLPGIARALTRASAADPLIALGAVRAAADWPPDLRVRVLEPLVSDTPRAVRDAAARALVGTEGAWPLARRDALRDAVDAGLASWRASRERSADRADALTERAALALAQEAPREAEALLRAALERQPSFAPAWGNLADLQRALGDDSAALASLDAGLEVAPEVASLHLARGLTLVRLGRRDEALVALRRAAELAPHDPAAVQAASVAELEADPAAARARIADFAAAHPTDPLVASAAGWAELPAELVAPVRAVFETWGR